MDDWRRLGHEQRRRIGAPTATLLAAVPQLEGGYDTGMAAQSAATAAAAALGHTLGSWEPYGRANAKARCMDCGAEARIPFSSIAESYTRPAGDAINPAVGVCREIAARHPNRKRGTR